MMNKDFQHKQSEPDNKAKNEAFTILTTISSPFLLKSGGTVPSVQKVGEPVPLYPHTP